MSGANDFDLETFVKEVGDRNPGQPEFLQAVHEVAQDVADLIGSRPELRQRRILERLTEPDRIISFRVCWEDDRGDVQINRGWRVQNNNAIGPYKGGLRFHPTVNESVLKFLAFEQTFKNSLTGLPMGGGKGGADFDPKDRSDREVMRFCQAFMTELYRHIGSDVDVPAGDIGVGEREIGYLFGQYKRVTGEFAGTLTGKGLEYGGSLVRTEATGYGAVYFLRSMLARSGDSLEGKRCIISGSGNVALHAAEKINELGGVVLTLSDSDGFVHDPHGIDPERLAWVKDLKLRRRGRIGEYAERYPEAEYRPGARPWGVSCDIALPCATQNEIDGSDAEALVSNGCRAVVEGANMPTDLDGIAHLRANGVAFAPGKAANAGGVAVSGLEMSQNACHLPWSNDELQARLVEIMDGIHWRCVQYGRVEDNDHIDYLRGANVAGFAKVADAMLAQGLC